MKAMLVIDMPKNCEECKLTYIHTRKDTLHCCITDREVEYANDMDNCPLKQMPRELDYASDWENNEIIFRQGWNACLEKLEK